MCAFQVLFEAQSFIIRESLLRILKDNLLCHCENASASEAYFGNEGLTRKTLKARLGAP